MSRTFWNILLELKHRAASLSEDLEAIYVTSDRIFWNSLPVNIKDIEWSVIFNGGTPNPETPCLKIEDNGMIEFLNPGSGCENLRKNLRLYLPFCLAPLITKKVGRPLAISHFAQTLDGFTATVSGHSKWIGNNENLVHAHRIRALVDAVIIGNNTLRDDHPKLNVRHVEGRDPARVVIGDNNHSVQSLLDSSNAPIIRFVSNESHCFENENIQHIIIPKENGMIPGISIMKSLYEQGIQSVLVEGGASTTSRFIKEKQIDIVQYHIAPILLGKGIPNFLNDHSVTYIEDGLRFHSFHFHPIGDAIMFTGYL